MSGLLERMVARIHAPISDIAPLSAPRYGLPFAAQSADSVEVFEAETEIEAATFNATARSAEFHEATAASSPVRKRERAAQPVLPTNRTDGINDSSPEATATETRQLEPRRSAAAEFTASEPRAARSLAKQRLKFQALADRLTHKSPDDPAAAFQPDHVTDRTVSIELDDAAPAAEASPHMLLSLPVESETALSASTYPRPTKQAGRAEPAPQLSTAARADRRGPVAKLDSRPPRDSEPIARTEVVISIDHIEVNAAAPTVAAPRTRRFRPRVTLSEFLARNSSRTR